MSVSESAVGAILQIPDDVLNKITTADRKIKLLAKASFDAANAVRTHWGNIAPQGLDTFIRKLADAQAKMQGMGNINLNLNVGQAQQQMDNLTNTVKSDSQKISEAVQTMNMSWGDFAEKFGVQGLNLNKFNSIDQLKDKLQSLKELRDSMTGDNQAARGWQTGGPFSRQQINDQIAALETLIKKLQESTQAQQKASQKVADTTNLNAQKTALERILQLEKAINEEELKQTKSNLLGKAIPQADVDRLNNYYNELIKVSQAYDELKNKTAQMSEAGRKRFNDADAKAELQRTNAQAEAQNKFNQALQRTSELTQLGKLKTGGIGSSEEAAYQRQLVGLYQEQIRLIRQWGDIRARAAADGRALTSAEYNQLQLLVDRYRTIEMQLQNVSGKYKEIDKAVGTNFQDAKAQQLADNAAKISAGMAKAQSSTAKLVAEYKQLYNEYEKLNRSLEQYNSKIAGTRSIGDPTQARVAAQDIAQRMSDIYARMQEIERKNIQEIAAFRDQKDMESNQKSISNFIQAEAQKRSEQQKTIDEQIAKAKIAGQQYAQSFAGAWKQYENLMSGSGSGKLAINFENIKRVLEDLKKASGKLNLFDPSDLNKAQQLKIAIETLTRLLQKYKDVASGKPAMTITDAAQLAQTARATKTLEDYTRAYEALKEFMGRTSTSDPSFKKMSSDAQEMKKHIDNIKKSMGDFQNQTRKTSDLMGMLGNRIAAAFSVGAVLGFLKKMVDIRAQFELQRVALGAIIQDTDEANKTFVKIQNMALESPFTIMQLERATKQIAAFGFETKKLVPTMKMFADISAGLGVEIDRLVLVMGHLKARNFLEGTMVRQFTNMGFNVLGELAKYYSEIEDKMISVGEVQDRVKKKMVSFEDVEEVLKRVTSAGGMFYEMQKKQSDSIWGQLQRITDAYDLMLNEIGQSNEGIIKFVLSTIRQAINSWRTLAPVIKTAAAAVSTYFTTAMLMKGIPMIINNIRTGFLALKSAQVAAKVAQDGLNTSMTANPYAAVIATVVALGMALYEVITYQDALTESMDRVREEGIGNMYNLIYQYQELTKTVNDTNSSYEDRKKALEELNRVFGDILPKEMLEEEYIRNIKDNYEEATKAIKAYSAEKIKANLKSEIENQVGKEIGKEVSDAADQFVNVGELWIKAVSDVPINTIRAAVKTIMTEVAEEVKNGEVPISQAADEIKKRIAEKLKNILPEDAISKITSTQIFNTSLDDVIDKLKEFKDEVDGLDVGFDGMESDELVIVKTRFEELKTAVEDYKKAIESLREAQANGQISNIQMNEQGDFIADVNGTQGQKALDKLNAALDSVQSNVKNFGITWTTTADEVNTAISSNADQMDYFDLITRQTLLGSLNNFNNWSNRFRNDRSVQNFVQNAQRDTGSALSVIRADVSNTMGLIAKKAGVQKSIFNKLKLDGVTSYDDVRKKAKELSDEAAENIKRINATRIEMIKLGYSAQLAQAIAEQRWGNGKTQQEIEQEQKAYESLWKAYGGYEKSSKKKSGGSKKDSELKRWQDLKKAIEEVTTEYEKYRKSYDVAESNRRIEEMYGPIFKELGVDIKQFYKDGVYDAKELIKALEVLKGRVNATTEERKKFASEISRSQAKTKVEIDLKLAKESEDNLKKQLDDMFANYELSAEFKKAGINVDLIYMLGGKPTTLDDIRAELKRLREEGGGDADAENRIKILEDAEKKLTQIELKEQKERLKNYEKYLKQMYSDRAKKMIEAYSMMENMERDFNSFIAKLQAEADSSDTTIERKEQIAEQIKSLQFQKAEAIKAVNEELNQNLAKLDWEQFKGSDVFTQLYQDTENLSKKGLDMLIAKLKTAREALQSMDKVDYKAVREITNHIEKLQKVRLDTDSWGELNKVIKESKDTIGKVSLEQAQQNMIDAQAKIDAANIEIANLETIIDLKEQDGQETDKIANLSDDLAELYKEDVDALRKKLKEQRNIVKEQQKEVDDNKEISDAYETQRDAINKKISIVNKLQEEFNKVYSSVVEVADALGADTDIWGEFGQAIGDSVFACITLTLQMQLMGIAANNALGIIGWIATALQVVANLLVAIFKAHDKRLEKQIEKLKDEVDSLDKAFQKLQKSIEKAFTIRSENNLTEEALNNLNRQKEAYQEMIRLEEAKKKTDDEKIKEYKEKLEELDELEQEIYENRREKWGSTNDVWGEANNWVDAWLDAYKETGDGLDALNQSWDDFYENLVKKQAVSAVLGKRMEKWINQINEAIDSGTDEYGMVDLYKQLGEDFKKEFGDANEWLKKFFEYAGISGNGEYILSDLQKGIQNITEPQAAAIEAYLNSMRFAVFQHTEQLDNLIAIISAQYGNGADNPIVTELKGIRIVLDRIDGRIESVITSNGSRGNVIKVN